eukprot:1092946-Rhodomonas_salina.1
MLDGAIRCTAMVLKYEKDSQGLAFVPDDVHSSTGEHVRRAHEHRVPDLWYSSGRTRSVPDSGNYRDKG